MARDRLDGPILVDSLDKPNAPQQQPTIKQYSPWPTVTLILVAALFLASITIFVIARLLELSLYGGFAAAILNAFYFVVLLSVAIIFMASGVYAVLRAFSANIHTFRDGVPLSMLNIWRGNVDLQRATDSYFNVMNTRAAQSRFQGVSTLTLDESSHSEVSTTSVNADEEETKDDIVTTKDKSILESLRDDGLINRSDNSLLMGFIRNEK